MKNNSWKKPELVVLTRTLPEEGVLTVCKIIAGSGASVTDTGCWESTCVYCDTQNPS